MEELTLVTSRSCVYNEGVECERKDSCEGCGWRPAVSRERLCAIRDARRASAEAQRREGMLIIGGVSA